MTGWWPAKTRQFFRHLFARVSRGEREALRPWLTSAQLALFDSMHRADKRHGLDVVKALRAAGHSENDLLVAGLLHDAGKGRSVGIWHRVAWSLGDHYGGRVRLVLVRLPGFGTAFAILDDHPDESARLALAAGCSPACADLIRHQQDPVDPTLGAALRLADEAS